MLVLLLSGSNSECVSMYLRKFAHRLCALCFLVVCPLRAFCLVPRFVPAPVLVHVPGLGGDPYSLVTSIMETWRICKGSVLTFAKGESPELHIPFSLSWCCGLHCITPRVYRFASTSPRVHLKLG